MIQLFNNIPLYEIILYIFKGKVITGNDIKFILKSINMRLRFIRCINLDRLQFAVNLDYNYPQQTISVFNIKVFKFCKILLSLKKMIKKF